jgi:hypothetical protein
MARARLIRLGISGRGDHEKLNQQRLEMAYLCAQLAAAGGPGLRTGADRSHILIE